MKDNQIISQQKITVSPDVISDYKREYYGIQGLEDGRHIVYQDEVYTSYTSFEYGRDAKASMVLSHMNKDTCEIDRIVSLKYEEDRIQKIYRAEVLGILGKLGEEAEINASIDGDSALTQYKVERFDQATTWVQIKLKTGRLHQIRRHFDYIGYPVMGDPKYGVGNKNAEGLKLWAHGLIFQDPFTRKKLEFFLPA
jgi:tRNA pseudouridine32 synthase/23S rRNA pseudouridine746 synthase